MLNHLVRANLFERTREQKKRILYNINFQRIIKIQNFAEERGLKLKLIKINKTSVAYLKNPDKN